MFPALLLLLEGKAEELLPALGLLDPSVDPVVPASDHAGAGVVGAALVVLPLVAKESAAVITLLICHRRSPCRLH